MKTRGVPLLEAVREVARNEDILSDPRWEALARGELSQKEIEALRGQGQRLDEADAYEVFRPLDLKSRERMIEHAMAAWRSPLEQEGAKAPASARMARRRRTGLFLVAAVAVSAALIIVLRPATEPRPGVPLPAYDIELRGGERDLRGEPLAPDSEPLLVAPETRLEIVLRPAVEVRGAVSVRCALSGSDGARPWVPPTSVRPGGVVRIAGSRQDLFAGIPGGRWEVICAVGRPEALPSHAKLLEIPPQGDAFRVLRRRVRLGDVR